MRHYGSSEVHPYSKPGHAVKDRIGGDSTHSPLTVQTEQPSVCHGKFYKKNFVLLIFNSLPSKY